MTTKEYLQVLNQIDTIKASIKIIDKILNQSKYLKKTGYKNVDLYSDVKQGLGSLAHFANYLNRLWLNDKLEFDKWVTQSE